MSRPILLIILLIVFALLTFILQHWSPVEVKFLPSLPKNSPSLFLKNPSPSPKMVSSPLPTPPSTTPYFGPRPETLILAGPEENSHLTQETKISFRFGAIWPNLEEITFETKLTPLEKDWQTTFNNFRSYNLLAGDHFYTFEVRAKTKEGIIDLTPAQRSFRATLSPYLGKVKIISVQKPKNEEELMKIVIRNESGSPLNLTNWQIFTSLGTNFKFPKVTDLFEQGKIPYLTDLNLNDGDYLILIGDQSPLNVDFRLNRCFGYLTSLYNFKFSFYKNCPHPQPEEINFLSPSCQNFLYSLSSCEIPSATKISQLDLLCQNYIYNKLNYQNCVNTYRYDRSFYEKEWYVFTGKNLFKLDNDIVINPVSWWIKLIDQNGQLVDFYQF